MGNISGKLNLRQLKSQLVEKDGKKFVVLPVAENNLYVGEKGVYLDFQGWEFENKQENSKDTHLIKQSLPKEVYSKLSDEDKKKMPIIGTLINWGGASRGEPDAQEVDSGKGLAVDDLPF